MESCFGRFFLRSLQECLYHVVECWQLSQPLHLRDLAIVRDTAASGTNSYYVYYTFENFRKLVDAGHTSWEAVQFTPRDNHSVGLSVPPVDAVAQVDEWGLPLPTVPDGQLVRNGNASLRQCVLAAKPSDYLYSTFDLVAVRQHDGSYGECLAQFPFPSFLFRFPLFSFLAWG